MKILQIMDYQDLILGLLYCDPKRNKLIFSPKTEEMIKALILITNKNKDIKNLTDKQVNEIHYRNDEIYRRSI